MKQNALKSFIQDTYKNTSPIPYIITGQVFMFVLVHIFDLLASAEVTKSNLYLLSIQLLSLPNSFSAFLLQPWSLLTHPFIYSGLFNLLFDCLWLYWIGKIFLNFLNNRQLTTIFGAGVLFGALIYLCLGSIFPIANPNLLWSSTSFGLAALISGTWLLFPNVELRLLLFGNVKLKYIALIYLGFEFAFLCISNPIAAAAYLLVSALGVLFIHQLQQGNDWSRFLKKKTPKSKLRVIKNNSPITNPIINTDYSPSQETIDEILDKISSNGYDSLSSREKEILFKASKQEK